MIADARSALVALNRFGYGPRAGTLAAAARDPRGFVLAELATPDVALIRSPDLPDSATALQALFEFQEQERLLRARVAADTAAQKDMVFTMAPSEMGPPPPPKPPNADQRIFRADALARVNKQIEAPCGFVERLVAFWSNHFCVSMQKGQFVRVTAGAYEREALRPHVLGRFADMVKAVEQHPAMLFYLDNQQSIGPNSQAGKNRNKGLNENLAREIMELHTLGVGGGYTQADVTSLARIITGWTFVGREGKAGVPGSFVFLPQWHEPGTHKLLGKDYAEQGIGQGEAALADIARHPSTARHIATKLVCHFVADDPPQPLVDKLAKVFRDTDGDLRAVSLALVTDDAAWDAPMTKMRNPQEFLIAAARAMGRGPDDMGASVMYLNAMGMGLWLPPGPNGFADTAAAWGSGEGLKFRMDVALNLASRTRDAPAPADMLETAFGAACSQETREAVMRAASKPQALALLFMSPEFVRR